METGTDFHGSVIRVNDEDRSTESASTDLLLFNLQGSDRESGGSLKARPMVWGCSSAGRAPALQAGGHGFESHHLHHPKGTWEDGMEADGIA